MDRWMDGWMQEQGDDDERSRGLSQGYGGMAEDPVRGGGAVGSGRWAVGASVASGAVVQWCSGARLVAAGVPVRCGWDVVDDGSDTW
jgi:hypothetical protein